MRKICINQNLIIALKSLLLTIIAIIFLVLMLSVLRRYHLDIPNDSVLGNILLEVTILVVQCLTIKKYCNSGKVLESLGLNNDNHNKKQVLQGVCIGLVGTIIIYSFIFINQIAFYSCTGFEIYSINVVLLFLISLFIRAFFAALCEEVFFRGMLLNYLSKYKGKIFGLVVSSFIFSIFHCTRYDRLYELLSVLFIGVTLGYLYLKTRSLYMSIGLHFATDFFAMLVSPKNQIGLIIFDINSKFSLDYLEKMLFILISVVYVSYLIISILIHSKYNKKR